MVACLKRLLPVGLNLFAGREQELVQHCKDRYLKVSFTVSMALVKSNQRILFGENTYRMGQKAIFRELTLVAEWGGVGFYKLFLI